MNVKMLKNINESPVRTWRWLGVNDFSMDDTIPEPKPYHKEIINITNYEGLSIQSINKLTNITFFDINKTSYGVSEELINMAKKQYNTGIYISSNAGNKVTEPIIINYYSDKENSFIIDNNIIVAEENSELTVVIVYESEDKAKAFHNGLTRVYAKKNAKVKLVKVQLFNEESQNIDSILSVLEDGAEINSVLVEFGGKNTVVNYMNDLKGLASVSNINSAYFGDKERNIDLNYTMRHFGKNTVSNIMTKGTLMDHSKKIFRGTLDFKRGASGAKGKEEEYAVLLSPSVRNRAVPLLLCSEENVEGAHAASAGKVDENMLFYIMSRGYSETEAKRLIIEASLNPIIDLIPLIDIKDALRDYIKRRL